MVPYKAFLGGFTCSDKRTESGMSPEVASALLQIPFYASSFFAPPLKTPFQRIFGPQSLLYQPFELANPLKLWHLGSFHFLNIKPTFLVSIFPLKGSPLMKSLPPYVGQVALFLLSSKRALPFGSDPSHSSPDSIFSPVVSPLDLISFLHRTPWYPKYAPIFSETEF